MTPIVTTSSRKKHKGGKGFPVVIILVGAIVAASAIWMLSKDVSQQNVPTPSTSENLAATGQGTDGISSTRRTSQDPNRITEHAEGAASLASSFEARKEPSSSPIQEQPRSDLEASGSTVPASAPRTIPAPQPVPVHKPIFDNEVENQLEAVSRVGFGSLQTPRVKMSHEETIEFLKRPIDIYDDDDEKTVAAKERTAAVKAAALDYIEQGGTLNQFLRDYAAQAKEERETVKDVKDEMKRILKAEGVEAAQAYLDGVNPQLKEAGLEEVKIGRGTIILMERERAREAQEAEKNARGY